MRHDTTIEMVKAAPAVVGAASAWHIHEYSLLASLIAATATAFYVLVQCAFLLRKWYLMEKRVAVPPTQPTPLD